jgi:hypothetical protein
MTLNCDFFAGNNKKKKTNKYGRSVQVLKYGTGILIEASTGLYNSSIPVTIFDQCCCDFVSEPYLCVTYIGSKNRIKACIFIATQLFGFRANKNEISWS